MASYQGMHGQRPAPDHPVSAKALAAGIERSINHAGALVATLWLVSMLVSEPVQAQKLFATSFESLESDRIIGSWSALNEDGENWLTIRADGSFSETYHRYHSFTGEPLTASTRAGRWVIDAPYLRLSPAGSPHEFYAVEPLPAGGFRLSGAPLRVNTLLYRKTAADSAQRRQLWPVGNWRGLSESVDFRLDGSYTLYERRLGVDNPTEEGTWRFDTDKLFLTPIGTTTPIEYEFKVLTRNTVRTTLFKELGLVAKIFTLFPAPVISVAAFAGRYSGPQTTLDIATDGTGTAIYGSAQVAGLSLTLAQDGKSAVAAIDGHSREFNVYLYDNWLAIGSGAPAAFTGYLVKQADQIPALKPELAGIWWLAFGEFGGRTFLYLLPDGRFYSSVGELQFDGSYSVQGEQLLRDYTCEGIRREDLRRVANQLVLSSENLTTHYIRLAASRPAAIQEIAALDAAERPLNEHWLNRIKLARIKPGPTPAGYIEGSRDPNPNTYYENATVFAAVTTYAKLSDIFWYLLLNDGSFVTVSAVNESDYAGQIAAGPFFDRALYVFFPNGRAAFVNETYQDYQSLNPVTPNRQVQWIRYRIDGDQLTVGAESVKLIGGRRILDTPRYCMDNLEWLDSQEQAQRR